MKRLFIVVFMLCLNPFGKTEPTHDFLPYFNPAKGFKPAQTNLTNVFLQLAGSIEHFGSPEPYLRHVQAEDRRVLRTFALKTGREAHSRLPAHMTPEYIDRLVANWGVLAPKLHLDEFAKEAGRCAREAIRGTRDTGTIVVEVFNEHQQLVARQMGSATPHPPDFERLRARIETELEFDKPEVSVRGYETARRDAVSYAVVFRGAQDRLFAKIDTALSPAKATEIKRAINGVFLDLGRMAQAELELAILESSLRE